MQAPQNPAGAFVPEENYGAERRAEFIATIADAPAKLRTAISGLSASQLDTRYRNWTIRQIVHHVPDSHVNAYIRFKLAVTEESPTIKPYDESRWAALEDSRSGGVEAPLALLDGIHACWTQFLRTMKNGDFARSYYHPEYNQKTSLSLALASYAWHCRHHTAQILWVREQRGW